MWSLGNFFFFFYLDPLINVVILQGTPYIMLQVWALIRGLHLVSRACSGQLHLFRFRFLVSGYTNFPITITDVQY